jgi:hypothetical protein
MTTTRYASASELSIQTGIDLTKYQAQVEALLDAASAAINNQCHRKDGFVADTTASTRTFVGSGKSVQMIDECVEITAVAVKKSITDSTYTAWSATDWLAFGGSYKRPDFNVLSYDEPRPYTGLLVALNGNYSRFTSGLIKTGREGFPPLDYEANIGQPTVQVTAKWGYAVTVPNAIKQATLIHAARFFKRGQAQWADALANADFGEIRFVKKTDPTYDYLVQHGFIKPGIG